MATFQTLLCLVILIFVLSVIVQAIQEVLKAALNTKAVVMRQTIEKFMGNHLTLEQVQTALHLRGLDITDLENLNKDEFRSLLDAVPFGQQQLQGIVASATATEAEIKDNIASSYEAARVSFQKAYTSKNKLFVIGMSVLVVCVLNANLITIYEKISSDQAAQQVIIGSAAAFTKDNAPPGGTSQPSQQTLANAYSDSRNQIEKAMKTYPILVRTRNFPADFSADPLLQLLGLFIMCALVSLGAPFWNDILKGMMGINNTLNSGNKKTS